MSEALGEARRRTVRPTVRRWTPPDPIVLEERVRAELQRLLGRQAQTGRRGDPVRPGLDPALLESRIGAIVRAQLSGPDADSRIPASLDLELLESQMRDMIRRKLIPPDQAAPAETRPAFDRDALEGRVRQEIERALNGGGEEQLAPDPMRHWNQQILEQRVRQEMAHRIPELKAMGWDGVVKAPAIDIEALAQRMRKAIRRALRDYRVVTSSRLSDDEIERMLERLIP